LPAKRVERTKKKHPIQTRLLPLAGARSGYHQVGLRAEGVAPLLAHLGVHLSRIDAVDQGGTRRPGGFFDGKVQSPQGTAGSTFWRHGFSGKNVVRLHG